MSEPRTILPTNTWVDSTWEEYTQAIALPDFKKAKSYYYNGQLKIQWTILPLEHGF